MGVYIRGMEMPTSCAYCRFEGGGYCFAKGEQILHVGRRDDVHPDCPLVLVPPHGRLIDADELRQDWLENGENEYVYDTNAFLDSLDNAPTIIEAEGGET